MQKFKKIFKVLIVLIFSPNILFANIINVEDIKLLGIKDKKYFLKKCYQDKKFKENSKCINFLGLKIYLNFYENNIVNNINFIEIERKSIFYLNIAAENGSKHALINLGWIYSNKKSSFYDLKKSAQYFTLSKAKKKEVIKNNKKNQSITVNQNTSYNRSYITLAISLMNKIDLYKNKSFDSKNLYLTNIEYEKAERAFEKIIKSSKIPDAKLEHLKKKTIEGNNIILSFLEKDLDNYNEKYRNDALRDLKQLLSIYDKLY